MVESVPGMKVLIMDKETTGIVSLVYSQSQILQKEVYLFERIDAEGRELMAHLKAICFLRPTAENVQALCRELRKPKYGEYHLFFSNIMPSHFLEELAEADEHEVVQQVQEFYADFYALNPGLFSLNIETFIGLETPQLREVIERTSDGLASVLLAFKRKPVIRCARNSEIGQRVAQDITKRMTQEKSLFDFRRTETAPLLIILDRRNDPVSPLLHQWTYQAMVHELLGIQNNRVDLSRAPGVRKELKEVVLTTEQDPFYKSNIYSNFGELGVNIKHLVDEFQTKTKSNQNIQSIADMKRFVEEYPEFRKLSGNVSKHVAVMSELSRLVDHRNLLNVSETEQELACRQDHSGAVKRVKAMLEQTQPELDPHDILKAVLLYTLRYENTSGNKVDDYIEKMFSIGFDQEHIGLISAIRMYAGASVRLGDLFENKSFIKMARSTITRGLKGVDNIYTEHSPMIRNILQQVLEGSLPEDDYPFVSGAPSRERPQEIFVFVMGGATYEEALAVHQLAGETNARILLGASTIHNSGSFIDELLRVRRAATGSTGSSRRRAGSGA
ncbi:vacuolar protein sortingassociated protein 45, putative [Acanthamoeba castellanii str. Neff]|uniref:Vacuolar protein sorting-associated protein 45 n=1 Tax=Acanthamoeba castellanii (strain ATCC 30010 / Neff) TaxID=1257118 RepID=L8GLQ1_ACACF|nr:vacuolar protein sortingassociated protein 45, putative [Acanthamoeba castellanii str. Neff]ELR14005.1 vacuolar protein sortingassociated protein 45, putative [Acanthamoeba castellanii str. Neff]